MKSFYELMDEVKATIEERRQCAEHLAFIRMRNTLNSLLPIKVKVLK
jgi:hypothetical protein